MTNLVKLDIESEPLGSEDGEIYETLSQKKAMEKQICPICMDDLEESTNRVNTECGHSFHTSCLMASVANLGFGCPCCRAEMAEEPTEENEEEENSDSNWDPDYGQVDYDSYDGRRRLQRLTAQRERETSDQHAFQGVRNMFLLAEGYEAEDVEDETEIWYSNETEAPLPRPSAQYVMDELLRDGSITMLKIIKSILLDHQEYEPEIEELTDHSDEIFERLCIIISNYQPSDTNVVSVVNNDIAPSYHVVPVDDVDDVDDVVPVDDVMSLREMIDWFEPTIYEKMTADSKRSKRNVNSLVESLAE